MLLERIEHELLDPEIGIINHFALIPEVQDCWEMRHKKNLILIYKKINIEAKLKKRKLFLSRLFCQKNK